MTRTRPCSTPTPWGTPSTAPTVGSSPGSRATRRCAHRPAPSPPPGRPSSPRSRTPRASPGACGTGCGPARPSTRSPRCWARSDGVRMQGMTTSPLAVEKDPAALGFDATRLDRIDDHFRRYVDDGRLAGWQVVVTRRGEVVHSSEAGQRDEEAGLPVEPDTRWRIYSMTKPITSVAAMILWERGELELTDPINRWLPAFAEPRVYLRGSATAPLTMPSPEPIRVWHLLSHTAGLTYGFHHAHPIDEMYRTAGFEWGVP